MRCQRIRLNTEGPANCGLCHSEERLKEVAAQANVAGNSGVAIGGRASLLQRSRPMASALSTGQPRIRRLKLPPSVFVLKTGSSLNEYSNDAATRSGNRTASSSSVTHCTA